MLICRNAVGVHMLICPNAEGVHARTTTYEKGWAPLC